MDSTKKQHFQTDGFMTFSSRRSQADAHDADGRHDGLGMMHG
jgi:hypothetical protein